MSNIFEHSYVFNPVDDIHYADEAVVSKTVIKKPTGNITLFAFDAGEGLSEHSTPHDALIQVLDGEAEITIAEKEFKLTSGQCIILPADIPHSVKSGVRFKMMLTMLKNI